MPSFKKRHGRWQIRFHQSGRDPEEKMESLPINTPKDKVLHIEGKMNSAYYDDWDPWLEDWKEYNRRKHMEKTGVVDSGLTLKEAIQVYIDKLSVRGRINSERTEENYRSTLENLAGFLRDPFMLSALTPRHAEMWLRAQDVADSTKGEYATRISSFFKYWHGRGMIRQSFEYNRRQKPREDQIKYLTEAQKDKIAQHYRENRTAIQKQRCRSTSITEWMDFDDFLNVLFYQGFRRAEVFKHGISRQDVNLGNGTIKVFGKGKKTRVVDITPPAREYIVKAYNSTSSPIDNLFPWNIALFVNILKYCAKQTLGEEYSWVSTHNLRHSCGTYWAGKGVPIATIQKLMGHANINTTMIYAKITDTTSKAHFEQAYYRETPITKLGNNE